MKFIAATLAVVAALALFVMLAAGAPTNTNAPVSLEKLQGPTNPVVKSTNAPLQSVRAANRPVSVPAPVAAPPAPDGPHINDIVRITTGFARANPGVVELDYLVAKVLAIWREEQAAAARKAP